MAKTDEQKMLIRVDVETAKKEVALIDLQIAAASDMIRRKEREIAGLQADRRSAERRIAEGEAALGEQER